MEEVSYYSHAQQNTVNHEGSPISLLDSIKSEILELPDSDNSNEFKPSIISLTDSQCCSETSEITDINCEVSALTVVIETEDEDEDDKLETCNICGYKSTSEYKSRTHVCEKSFACHKCGYKTTVKRNLRRHVLIHAKKNYKCKLCNYTFKTDHNLKQHVVIHDAANRMKRFKCDACKNRYVHKSSLKNHISKSRPCEWYRLWA